MRKADWYIRIRKDGARYAWAIPYPISRCAIVGTASYKTKDGARQAAWRSIRRLSK